ncbi:peptidase family M1 [Colletotrichum acutatum]|uniref:Peptidase family M1 n=1 Tax=Glomerella acutata TaxID=27357 RepID=A0AAD8XH33_GLOAC|nr:peptidase family M1 [Colletotrichum acutatum]KAK1727724.1 peptidase family M1 [Colletotrichum acutatum]
MNPIGQLAGRTFGPAARGLVRGCCVSVPPLPSLLVTPPSSSSFGSTAPASLSSSSLYNIGFRRHFSNSSVFRAAVSTTSTSNAFWSSAPTVGRIARDAFVASYRRPSSFPAPVSHRNYCSTITTSDKALYASRVGNMADREVLPESIRPSHYVLSLRDLNFKDWTYKGTVTIDAEVVKPTKEIVLNALEIKLLSAKIAVGHTKSTQSWESTNFSYGEKQQRATVTFDEEIPQAQKAVLTIEFEGIINNEMAGFYRSKYKPAAEPAKSVPRDDEWHYMFSTQFESCDARRAFPCFDEPNLKATFDFEIEIPEDQVALSNMPVKDTKKTKEGWQLVSFETSPKMSTYLLAWAVGDFEYVEEFTERRYNGKQLPVRVYTTRGLKEQGRYALWHAPRIIDFFSDIFGIEYPLPKADLLAVHEFTHGAMENWGLVTYRTTAVLFDEKTSEARYRNRVAYVVAHELAHQWFGNLVTMDWWDELWLNEGFATWVGWHATDYLHPEWQVWSQFVNEGMEMAFKLDGIRASHAIHVPVKDALDVNQIFDHISYLKGCSAIRMLANHLGVETFLKGVSNYLKAHQYGNAKTKALWDALTEASGKDVNKLMGPWISKIGHPVLTVAEEPGQISVKQSRFLSTGDVKPEDDETTWWIPLEIEGKVGTKGVTSLSLEKKEDTIRDIDTDFYKLNSGSSGFYRVNYPPERLLKLGQQLDRLTTEDKIAIIGSSADLAFSGYGTTAALLSFVQGFAKEDNYLVWSQVLDSIALVKSIFSDDETIKKGLETFTLKLINDVVAKMGWEFPEGESYLDGLLRKRVLLTAGVNGHAGVTEEATKRFNAWVESPESNPLHPALRTPVFRVAIKNDTARAVEALKKEWFTTPAIDGKEICLSNLGFVRDEDIIKNNLLPFLFNKSPPAPASDSVPSADMHSLGSALAGNSVARQIQWDYVKNNWEACLAKLGNPIVVDRFIQVSLGKFTDFESVKDIEAFFADKDTSAFARTLETVKDKVRGRAAYRERDAAKLKEWLVANKYA